MSRLRHVRHCVAGRAVHDDTRQARIGAATHVDAHPNGLLRYVLVSDGCRQTIT